MRIAPPTKWRLISTNCKNPTACFFTAGDSFLLGARQWLVAVGMAEVLSSLPPDHPNTPELWLGIKR